MEDFFSDCLTVCELKKLYLALALKHHPARGGDLKTIERVNVAYHEALQRRHLNDKLCTCDVKPYEVTYRYFKTPEESVVKKISDLLSLSIPDIEIKNGHLMFSSYVAIKGEHATHSNKLNGLGFEYSRKLNRWLYTAKAQINGEEG